RLVFSYTVFSPDSRLVSLGAGLRAHGTGGFISDGANDRTLTISAGESVITRTFDLPNSGAGAYDVAWGLWSGGFGTQYGIIIRDNLVTVVGPTATPTFTPAPTDPVLRDVALEPGAAELGSTIVLSYTVFSPGPRVVGLGADMALDGT